MANKLSNIVIDEVAFCKKGMNQHAKITLFKAAPSAAVTISKYYSSYSPPQEAMDFKQVLDANEKHKKLYNAREELYPIFEALSASIASIITDTSLSDSTRSTKIDESVNNFLSAVKGVIPDVDEELQKMFEDISAGVLSGNNPDGDKMSEEVTKKLEAVEKALAEKTALLEKAEKDIADMKAADEKKKKDEELSKSDETLVVEGQKISKAAVGESQFAVFKAMNEKLAKAENDAHLARLEKRAQDEFAHLPGTDAEKAAVLKAVGGLDEASKAYVESVLKSAEEKNSVAFKEIGVKKAVEGDAAKMAKVNEIAKRDNISMSKAMEKAAAEAPELFK